MDNLPLIVALAVVVIGIAALGILVSRGERSRLALARGLDEVTGRLKAVAESQAVQTKTIEERLEAVSGRMGVTLKDSATETARSVGALENRLSVIDKAQQNITELSDQMLGLQDILANKQARGAFGQVQLVNIVQAYLAPSEFDFEVTLSNGKRADCVVRLPYPPGPVAIDAKFPLESYNALLQATDAEARTKVGRAFADDVLKHVRDIADKYILPGETADWALLFLPSEAVFAELHANFGQVVERSHTLKIGIVSPTTMMGALTSIRAILKDVRMRQQAGLIQKEVGALLRDVRLLRDRTVKLQSHFNLASDDISGMLTSSDRIARKAARIEDVRLEDETQAVTDLDATRSVVRR
jgi:DNA recombination protein RmuC